MREDTLRDERLEVSVSFDDRRGYVSSAPDLRQPRDSAQLGRLEAQNRDRAAARRCAGRSVNVPA
jgi:hypothetical protein